MQSVKCVAEPWVPGLKASSDWQFAPFKKIKKGGGGPGV